MLRSVYAKTLRDMRWGILGWGLGLGILVVTTGIAWAIAYPDVAARTDFANQLNGGLSAAQVFYGPPHRLETLGGFVEWRGLGLAPELLGLYLILAGTGMTRGAEESGTIEVVMAAAYRRPAFLTRQIAALATGAIVACALLGILAWFTAPLAGEGTLPVLWVAEAALNICAASLVFGMLGVATAQAFGRRRSAALAATGLMVAAHLANTLPLVVPELHAVRYVTPARLYTASSPLADGSVSWPALAALAGISLVLAAVAVLGTARRDLFDTLHRRRAGRDASSPESQAPARPAAGEWFFGNALRRGLRDSVGPVLAWSAGIALFAVFMTALTPNVRESLLEQTNSVLGQQLEKAGVTTERGILSLFLSSFVPPLVAIFAMTLAAAWASDEVNQRLELELVTPAPRWKLLVQRAAAAVFAVAAALALVAAATVTTVELAGIDVPAGAVAAALGSLALLGAAVVGVGFVLASWRPALVVPLGGAFIAVSYFADLVIALAGWPDRARDFFVFGLYGAPLADGVSVWRVGTLAGAAVLLVGIAAVRFERRDILK